MYSDPEIQKRRRRELGDRVRSLRLWRGRTQEGLALAAALDRTAIQDIEGGKTNPKLDTLWAVADALNVPLSWLVSDQRPPEDGDVTAQAG